MATYFSEKFGSQIQRQVITRINSISTPETFSNLPIGAAKNAQLFSTHLFVHVLKLQISRKLENLYPNF